MSNTIQIKRFNETGETPDDRGTVLAYGELAVNTADNTLWVGNNIGVNQLLSAHTRIGPDEPVMPADKLIGTFWFDTTIPESIKVWNGTAFVTFVGGDPVEPGGQVDSVVAGTNVTVDNTDPANPIVSATGGGETYAIDESSRVAPGPWLAFETLGVEDKFFFNTNAYQDRVNDYAGDSQNGYQFELATTNQKMVIEDGQEGVKLLGYHYETGNDEGLELHGVSSVAPSSTIRLITNSKTSIKVTDGSVELPSIPTTDPGNQDEIWSDSGTLVMSGSTAGGGGGSSDVEVLDDLADVQVGVGYAGFTEYVSSTALLQENYQYVVAGDYMAFMNATAEAAMQRFVSGDQIIFTWGEGGPGKTVTKTIQNGSQFNNATTEYIRWTSSGGWPTDPAILALPLFLTSNPERFLSAAEGDVLTFDGANWVPEQSTGGATELNDLDDVSLGHSKGTQSKTNDTLPTAPGEFRVGSTFMQVYFDVEDHWALYEVGDELTFVWNNGDVTGPFEVTTVLQEQNATVRTLYLDGPQGARPNDGGEGTGGGMTVFSNPERAVPETGTVLTYDGTNWVAEAPSVEVLNDLSDVSLIGFSESTITRPGSVPTAPGEYRLWTTFIQTHISHREQWEKYQLGDELTFVYSTGLVKGPFTVTTAYAIDPGGSPWGIVYLSDAPNGDSPDDGALQEMTVFSNPERAMPETGEVLTYDGTNWVPQELAEFTDRAVLDDLDDVDLDFSVNVGIDDNVIGDIYTTPGAYRIPDGTTILTYRKEIHDQMSSLQVDDIFYFRWPSVNEVAGPYRIQTAPTINTGTDTYYLVWRAAYAGDTTFPIPAGDTPMYITSGTPVGHALVFDGINWVAQAAVDVLNDLTDVDTGDYEVLMGADGDPESRPGLWEFGGAGNTIIYHNSISAEMSEFLVGDAVYITWPAYSLSYGPFIITVAPAVNTANTEYLRVDQTINGITIPTLNDPMSLKRIGVSSGDVLTYDGTEWISSQPDLQSLTDVSFPSDGYTGHTDRAPSNTLTSGQYFVGFNSLTYHPDQEADMSIYEIGDWLQFNYADGTVRDNLYVKAKNVLSSDGINYVIAFDNTNVNVPAGALGEGMTIISDPDKGTPERYPAVESGDVLTYNGTEWVGGKGLAAIKEATAAATDFADFQARIAAL